MYYFVKPLSASASSNYSKILWLIFIILKVIYNNVLFDFAHKRNTITVLNFGSPKAVTVIALILNIQLNVNGSNINGSFTTAISKSF